MDDVFDAMPHLTGQQRKEVLYYVDIARRTAVTRERDRIVAEILRLDITDLGHYERAVLLIVAGKSTDG